MAEYLKSNGSKSKRPGAELKRILTEIRLSEKELERYNKQADEVVKRYRDEDRSDELDTNLPPRFNILWSNTETTTPLYYARVPRVQVDRRFKDADMIGREACTIWERATQFAIDNYDFSGLMQAVVKDYQLAGRGTAWIRYHPTVAEDGIQYQEVLGDHVHYKDFGHSMSKQWRNVRAVWRRIYLTKKQLKARFKDIWKDIPLDYSPTDSADGEGRQRPEQKEYQQACIYEYWDTDTMQVYWVSKNYSGGVLDMTEDPLGLHDFFPTPKPLFAVTTNEKLIPIPEYCLYQDQAKELDRITMKIGLLQDSLRMVGAFDQTYEKELKTLYQNTSHNQMIPIANWQKLQSAGGIKGIAEWMPLNDAIQALTALQADRQQVKQDLYEITGIGDIIRGANGGQDLTAAEVKVRGRFASIRVEDKKKEVERYGRDLIALHGEVIAEHFEPDIIAAMTGAKRGTPEAEQTFQAAIQLLRNDPMRSFRLTLETDSMAAVDEALEKAKTMEFVKSMGSLLEGAIKVATTVPVLAPMVAETMLFTVRRFNAGRGLEDAVEKGMQGLVQMAQQALQQPKQDPEMMKTQAKIQLEQVQAQKEMELKQMQAQKEAETKQIESQGKIQLEQAERETRMQLEQQKAASNFQLQAQKFQQELALAEMDIKAKHKLEQNKAILAAKPEGLSIMPDGSMTTRPIIKKTARFKWDPMTGDRVADIIEVPVAEVPTSPIEADQEQAQVG